jgi:hypothetical protein
MSCDTREDVGEPGLRINAIHLGCNDQTIHGSGALPTTVGSTEQPGFTPQCDAPKTALGCIVGEADASVCQETM